MEQKYFKMTTKADFVIQRKSPATAGAGCFCTNPDLRWMKKFPRHFFYTLNLTLLACAIHMYKEVQ